MRIQITCGPGETLAFAARELNGYLSRMLAAEDGSLTAVLSVERTENLPEIERFKVSMSTEGGSIIGNCPRAVLLGVYDYLRYLGCRFLGPGEQCEVVPAVTREMLAADYEKKASFRHRGVCIEGADSRENVLDFIDWLPKAGYNSFFLQFKNPYAFLKRWYHHERNPLREPEPYTPADAERDMALFEMAMKQRGLLLHKAGHGWTGEALGYDSLSWDAEQRPPGGGETSPGRAGQRKAGIVGRRAHQYQPVLCQSGHDRCPGFPGGGLRQEKPRRRLYPRMDGGFF